MQQYFVMDKEFLYTDEYILIPSLSAEDLQEVEDSHRRISGCSYFLKTTPLAPYGEIISLWVPGGVWSQG